VFTEFSGIPAHPLIIHFAVVFIPLLVVAAIVYAAWPPFRRQIWWATLGLAIIAPLSALFAKLSGQDFKARLIQRKEASGSLLQMIDQHNSYGNDTFWWTIALGVLTLALLAYTWWGTPRTTTLDSGSGSAGVATSSNLVRFGSTVVMLVVGGFVSYYVFKTGDTGAHIVWKGI
jgi:hypothetical protein